MLSNKTKIIILVIILVFAIILIYNLVKKDNSVEIETSAITTIDESQIKQDEESGEYYILDEDGNIAHSSYDEKELEIYTVDPDYEVWDPDESDSDTDIDNYEE